MTVSVAVVRPPKYKSPDSTVCGVSPCLGQLPVSGASQATDPWLGHTGTLHDAGILAISSHQCRDLLSHIMVLYSGHTFLVFAICTFDNVTLPSVAASALLVQVGRCSGRREDHTLYFVMCIVLAEICSLLHQNYIKTKTFI